MSDLLSKYKRFYFVGIGGEGMSGVAEMLLQRGYQVSGSDAIASTVTTRLQDRGAQIYIGHAAQQLSDEEAVVISSAIADDNSILKVARMRKIPIFKRAEVLAALMQNSGQIAVAVAGTHGKTTTTALLAEIAIAAELQPSIVIGARLNAIQANSCVGQGRYFIVEADESDTSFLLLSPQIAVITNISADHLGSYGGDFEQLKGSFKKFLQKLPSDGVAILNIDDPIVRSFAPKIEQRQLTYGFSSDADIHATAFSHRDLSASFKVEHRDYPSLSIQLPLLGKHNVYNALAAIAVATTLDISAEHICQALKNFQGVDRRFQYWGQRQLAQARFLLIEDYGHHPKELEAIIATSRQSWPEKKLTMVFQPHRYTRTRDLFSDFIKILSTVDSLYLLPLYPAGEATIAGADSYHLYRDLCEQGMNSVYYVEQPQQLVTTLRTTLKDDTVLLMQGAGNINQIIPMLLAAAPEVSEA